MREVITRYFFDSEKELHVGGLAVGELAERFGTPLFVYDQGVLDRKWGALREALPGQFAIHYSVKANPNEVILRHFLSKGCGLEIASGGELLRALEAGCPPERILFAGPGKTEAELELAVGRGIGEVHVESALEARRVASIARRLGIRTRVGIRVNPGAGAQGGAMRMGGKPAPFGVDEERLDSVLDLLEGDPWLDFRGIHLFAGTQILDYSVLMRQYRHGLEVGRRVAARTGRPLATIDFGGGLGVPYFAGERELEIDKLQHELERLMSEVANDAGLAGTRFVVEPGRYLVAEAGVYIARINDVKVSRGKTFVILDGGMNHHLAASGNLGQVIKRNFPIAVVNRLGETSCGPADVVGPLCTPLDTLGRDVSIPWAATPGDLVGVFQSGAYGLTASPIGFLSHATPAEILVSDGQVRVIRARGSWQEHGESALAWHR